MHNSSSASVAVRDRLADFFKGGWYPIAVGAIVFLGHTLSIEFYLNVIGILLICTALIVQDSLRPFIIFVTSFVFQVSVKYAPGLPNFSDYYFTSWRLPLVIILALALVSSLVYFAVKNKIFDRRSLVRTPLLIPLLALSLSFLTSGAFSEYFNGASFLYGALQALVYTAVFVFFYHGLKREEPNGLTSYFIYSSAVLAGVLILQVLEFYITSDGHAKDDLLFGWGIWNTAGISLAVLIPVCFLGFIRERYRYAYLVMGVLTFVATVFTQSRNAQLFGGLIFALCILLCLFFGRDKLLMRIVCMVGALCAIAGVILLRDKIPELLSSFFNDNGRYDIWRAGIDKFLEAPVFGVGFFGFDSGSFTTAEFLPNMAHQTFVQILCAMGVFGLLAYLFYRGATLVPFIKRPSITKTMLLLSIAVLLLESLLDNFIFYYLPTLYYSITLAVVFVIRDSEKEKTE